MLRIIVTLWLGPAAPVTYVLPERFLTLPECNQAAVEYIMNKRIRHQDAMSVRCR